MMIDEIMLEEDTSCYFIGGSVGTNTDTGVMLPVINETDIIDDESYALDKPKRIIVRTRIVD